MLSSTTHLVIAGVYQRQDFPDECQREEDCVGYIQATCSPQGLRANIHVPGLKTLWIEPPDGRVSVTTYVPGVRFTKTLIVFSETGVHEGAMQAS